MYELVTYLAHDLIIVEGVITSKDLKSFSAGKTSPSSRNLANHRKQSTLSGYSISTAGNSQLHHPENNSKINVSFSFSTKKL